MYSAHPPPPLTVRSKATYHLRLALPVAYGVHPNPPQLESLISRSPSLHAPLVTAESNLSLTSSASPPDAPTSPSAHSHPTRLSLPHYVAPPTPALPGHALISPPRFFPPLLFNETSSSHLHLTCKNPFPPHIPTSLSAPLFPLPQLPLLESPLSRYSHPSSPHFPSRLFPIYPHD